MNLLSPMAMSSPCEADDGRMCERGPQPWVCGGFKAIWGDDASAQPGHLQEVLLHETAVSWIRHRLEQSLPKKAWEETPEKFGARLRKACAEINAELDVVNLCHDFTSRVQELVDSEGDRLKH